MSDTGSVTDKAQSDLSKLLGQFLNPKGRFAMTAPEVIYMLSVEIAHLSNLLVEWESKGEDDEL